jgi:hypothetical protein
MPQAARDGHHIGFAQRCELCISSNSPRGRYLLREFAPWASPPHFKVMSFFFGEEQACVR